MITNVRPAFGTAAAVGLATLAMASNRFHVGGRSPDLAVVDVCHALAGRPARLLGYLPAGQIPREMTTVPSAHLLLVDNYGSGQIESVDLTGLP
jgi:hypothetical protein